MTPSTCFSGGRAQGRGSWSRAHRVPPPSDPLPSAPHPHPIPGKGCGGSTLRRWSAFLCLLRSPALVLGALNAARMQLGRLDLTLAMSGR